MSSGNEDFVNGCSVKALANQCHNCESKPIFRASGPVIESVSCMPLHLSLGLGKQTLEIVENEAIVLDKTIKEADGEACPELAEAFQRRETLKLSASNSISSWKKLMKPLIMQRMFFSRS